MSDAGGNWSVSSEPVGGAGEVAAGGGAALRRVDVRQGLEQAVDQRAALEALAVVATQRRAQRRFGGVGVRRRQRAR